MPMWLCAFDLEEATVEDYEEIYVDVHRNKGVRYWKANGQYYRYPSTTFKLPMESTSSSDALDELKNFLRSCISKNISHTAVGGDLVTAGSVPIDVEDVPQEVRDIIG